MATISENLQILKDSTDAIKQAIIDKGGTINGDITTWASAIGGISGGGSTNGPGSVFKITNKLNGQLFGGPLYTSTSKEVFHTYQFGGEKLSGFTILPINCTEMCEDDTCIFPYSYIYYIDEPDRQILWSVSTEPCGAIHITFNNGILMGELGQDANTSSSTPLTCLVIAASASGNYDIDTVKFQGSGPCLLKDTKITLSDNTIKLIQDITYNDELLVWNFDEGKYESAKPLWIKKKQLNTYYFKCILEDGTVLNLTGPKSHRLFSVEDNTFIYGIDMVGKTTYTENGLIKVVSCEKYEKECEYYNIITDYHMNLFANGILTSCRYNNLYPIQDMKFVKDDRLNRAPKWKLYEQFGDYKCLGRYIEGMRLYEQLDIPLEDTIKYCERLESLRKSLDEFEGNEKLLQRIEDTEVGWIDRNGNVYGFKHYMPGQYNHIILSDKICKELNVQTDNPSRYLEKLGWVKYTTDFILNSDDEYINKNQLDVIKKFVNIPGKLKTEGYIKIGTAFDTPTSINDFNNMDEYSFEFRKRNSRKIWQQDK